MIKLAGLLLLLLLMNCPGNDSNQTSTHVPAGQASLNQEFMMRVGEDIVFKGAGLQVRFVSVLEDSRCPKGEQCITEGNGRIELQLKKPQKELATLELNTTSGSQMADYEEFEIKLVGLDPYPKMGRSIKPANYVVTLVVSKKGSSRV